MCSLTFSRVFRCLVCLLLVCCVLINISPIRTYAVATVTTGSLVGISALAAVTGILACLGIAYIGYTDFDELCQQIADAIPSNFLITVDKKSMVSGLRIKDTVYVSEDLIRHVAASVPTIYTVSDSFPLSDEVAPYMQLMVNCADYSSHISDDISYYSRFTCFRYSGDGDYYFYFSNLPLTYTNHSDNTYSLSEPYDVVFYSVSYSSGSPPFLSGDAGRTDMHSFWSDLDGYNQRSHFHGQILNFVTLPVTDALFKPYVAAEPAPDLDDDEEYQAWKARRQFRVIKGGDGDKDPDDDGDEDEGLRVLGPYFPVPAAINAKNLPESQELAWAGNRAEDPEDDPVSDPIQEVEVSPNPSPAPDPSPDPDPEPDPEPDPDPDPDPDPAPEPALDAADLEPFKLPVLKNFFPFCIPFDLYDMLSAFVAEPEAPVFTFATAFLGHVYTVDIDLSAWDNIAKTIRAIQLCICIVGLAFATRKFIKW